MVARTQRKRKTKGVEREKTERVEENRKKNKDGQ